MEFYQLSHCYLLKKTSINSLFGEDRNWIPNVCVFFFKKISSLYVEKKISLFFNSSSWPVCFSLAYTGLEEELKKRPSIVAFTQGVWLENDLYQFWLPVNLGTWRPFYIPSFIFRLWSNKKSILSASLFVILNITETKSRCLHSPHDSVLVEIVRTLTCAQRAERLSLSFLTSCWFCNFVLLRSLKYL